MCNACGYFCCASDEFSECGCDHCPHTACHWSDETDYDDEFFCEEIKTKPHNEPHQILGEALKRNDR